MSSIKSISGKFDKKLSEIYDIKEVIAIRNLVFTTVLNCNSADLIIRGNESLDEITLNNLNALLQELEKGKPVQYVLGETEFLNLKFNVSKSALIPRQETELLVQWILDENKTASPKILDIGTGSGIIPIALKKNIKNALVFGLDVSIDALKLARENATLNKVEISFFEFNVLTKNELSGNYNIIVSNPPYVPMSDFNTMPKNVKDFEPGLALFVSDDNPLLFYERIAELSLNSLIRPGKLYFEIYELHAAGIKQMLEQKGFQNVIVKKDMAEKNRMIKAELS